MVQTIRYLSNCRVKIFGLVNPHNLSADSFKSNSKVFDSDSAVGDVYAAEFLDASVMPTPSTNYFLLQESS